MDEGLTAEEIQEQMQEVLCSATEQLFYVRYGWHAYSLVEEKRLADAKTFIEKLMPIAEIGIGKNLIHWHRQIDYILCKGGQI